MSVELYRRARRAEAKAARAPDRRRLRLEFFRQALAEGFDSLKVRHAEGASGQESVRTYARLMDDVIHSLTRLAAADATSDGLAPTPLVVVALGGYGRGELHPLSDIDLMVIYDGEGYPPLRDFLKRQGIRHVLLAGYNTDMCVCSTTAGYKNLSQDFDVFLVGDATIATFPAHPTPRFATTSAVTAGWSSTGNCPSSTGSSPIS